MVFEDFCSNTSLHGWRFVPMTKHPVGRTLWAFIAVSSIGVAGLFIHTAVKDFFSATGMQLLYFTEAVEASQKWVCNLHFCPYLGQL